MFDSVEDGANLQGTCVLLGPVLSTWKATLVMMMKHENGRCRSLLLPDISLVELRGLCTHRKHSVDTEIHVPSTCK